MTASDELQTLPAAGQALLSAAARSPRTRHYVQHQLNGRGRTLRRLDAG